MKEQLEILEAGFRKPRQPNYARRVYDFDHIRYDKEPVVNLTLPVGKIVVCNEVNRFPVEVKQVYDVQFGDFYIVDREEGCSWKAIGVTPAEQSKVKKTIVELHQEKNLDPVFINNHLVRINYALFLEHSITIITSKKNVAVDVRFLYATEQKKLIRAQFGKWNSWKALGLHDNGDSIKITVRSLFEKELDRIELNRIQGSFSF